MVVAGERDGVHLQVALEQPAPDALVVLVGAPAHEGVHAQGVRPDVEADGRLQLLLAGQCEGEDAVGDLVGLELVVGEVAPHDLDDLLTLLAAHAVTSARISCRARS